MYFHNSDKLMRLHPGRSLFFHFRQDPGDGLHLFLRQIVCQHMFPLLQDLSDLERLRELFEAFSRKREILQLLERTVDAPGVRIFIGEETGLAPLEGVSLVTASYGTGGQVLGVLGAIGPTRMAYERVIPVVQATAGALGAALDAAGEG